jgi:hypothetical protein
MIIVKLKGGMGNQMFQYALGRAMSVKYNVPLGLDLSYLLDRTPRPKFHKFTFRDYDLDLFNIKAEILPQSRIPFIHRQNFGPVLALYLDAFGNLFNKFFNKKRYFSFDKSILDKGPNAYLSGNWISPKYFSNIKDIIREEFKLKNVQGENIVDLSKQISNENSLCIYMRRRDYVGNSLYDFIDDGYYNRGIEYINKSSKIDKIYVFSDDIEWCKKNVNFNLPTFFVDSKYEGERFVGYLHLMTFCKYFIIANSTFSWWGAWLSKREGKIVITPSKWVSDNSVDIDDIIEKEWIKI